MVPDPTNPTIETLLQHAGWLDELARRLVSDRNEADELVQDTWIAALTHPPEHASHLRGWLARVARNLAVQRGRSERARKVREQSVAREEISSAEPEAIERARTLRRLVDAVLALDEPYRSTLVLHYFERMPIADIAARQAVAESTVRTRMWRAIGMLRKQLRREGGEAWSIAFVALAAKHTADPQVVTSAAAASTSGALIGGIAMATAWKVGASIAAVIVLGWALWPKHDDSIVRGLDVAKAPEKPVETLSAEGVESAPRIALASEPVAVESAASPAPTADRASLDVYVKWGDDNTPAAGIVVTLWQAGTSEASRAQRTQATDDLGLAHFEDALPGTATVRLDRCEGGRIDLDAGQQARLDLTVPDGIDVDVHVVDEQGNPAPHARIWISSRGSQNSGAEMGATNASGYLHVRDLGPERCLAALSDGHGPSTQKWVTSDPKRTPIKIELELTNPLGRIRGIVRDTAGAPIARANVLLAGRNDAFTVRPSNETGYFPSVRVLSDESGAFEARDLRYDDVWVTVSARGFVNWDGTLYAGLRNEVLDVRLAKEAVVHGTLRDESGAPIAKAWVSSTLFGKRYGGDVSRVDGTYRIAKLPAGRVELTVDANDRGTSRRTIDLKEGDDTVWDLTLRPNQGVTGRVVDEGGKPLASWRVAAVEPRDQAGSIAPRKTLTDEDGRFEFPSWPAEAFVIEVREPEGSSRDPAASRSGVKAGNRDIVLVVRAEDMGTSSIRGRVLDPQGMGMSAAEIDLHQPPSNSWFRTTPDHEGRFEFKSLRPGSYWIDVVPDHAPSKELHDLDISAPGRDLDLGDIHIAGSGDLKVHLHLPASFVPDARFPPTLTLRKPGAELGKALALKQDVATLDGIEPGEYELLLFDIELRTPRTRVKVELNHTTEIDLTAELATCRGLRFVLPADAETPKSIRISVFDSTQTLVDEGKYPGTMTSGLTRQLTVGKYRLEAETDTGLKATVAFGVDTLARVQDVLRVELH